MLSKMEPAHLSSKGRLDFSKAEIGDEFYKIERAPYSGSISSVQKMTVVRTGKRDVFAVSAMYPKNELKINKEKDFHDVYLEKSEVQWAIDKIILHKKQRKVFDYIQKNINDLSGDFCDAILEQAKNIQKNVNNLSGDFCDAVLNQSKNQEEKPKNNEPFFAGAETGEDGNGEDASSTHSNENLYRPE